MSDGIHETILNFKKNDFDHKLMILKSKKIRNIAKMLIELQTNLTSLQRSNLALTKKQWKTVKQIDKILCKIFKESKSKIVENLID